MAQATILFVDNNPDFLKSRSEFLEKAGYRVLPAVSLEEARMRLIAGGVDLLILDIRMEDDTDAEDTSGLEFARESAATVPKIILTAFPGLDYMRQALGPQLERLPLAVGFVAKQEDDQVLLRAVEKALEFGPEWFQRSIDATAYQLNVDTQEARRQSRWNYLASLIVAGLGCVIIFVGAALSLGGAIATGVVSAIAGVITEAVSYLFFKRVDAANARMDQYHSELLDIKQLEILLRACDALPSADNSEKSKEAVIAAARVHWFEQASPTPPSQPSKGS